MKTLMSFALGFVFALLGASVGFSKLKPDTQDFVRQTITEMYESGRTEVDSLGSKISQIPWYFDEAVPIEHEQRVQHSNTQQREESRTRDRLKRELDEVARKHGMQIDTLVHTVSEGWSATLDSGIVINLGNSDLLQRFDRYVRARNALSSIGNQVIEVVDTRYEHGLAITWKEGQSDGSQTTGKR